MRCDNCPYLQYDFSEDAYYCVFGFEGEDSKGRCGCRYNMKTLNKFNKERLDDLANDCEQMVKFFEMEEK